jgi:flavin-dependent dehydrogenase
VRTLAVEVCVIGGGPAGATIARRLALLGHTVCLIEREPFPRRHIGESLPPGILPLFDFIGLRQQIEQASFLRPEGAIVRWGGVQRQLDFTSGAPGFQVDRGRFDQLLLDAAKESGVTVLQPASARRPEIKGDQWHVPVESAREPLSVEAAFLVDASGRRSLLAGRRERNSKPTLALYAYWRNTRFEGAETRVEAGQSEWFWGAPLPDRTFNATAFVHPSRCRKATGERGLETFYRSLLANSTLLRGCLKGELSSRVYACDASTYVVNQAVTPRLIKVGEASFAIDPLSSQGVQAAMASAVHGSIVVHTLLTCPANSTAALQFYRDRQTETAAFHQRIAAQYYSEQNSVSHESFWQERAGHSSSAAAQVDRITPGNSNSERKVFDENCRLRRSQNVRFEQLPCIIGDTIQSVTTVAHPSLERPVAFLKNIEIAPLLSSINSEETIVEILRRWSGFASRSTGLEIVHWMYSSGLLVQVDD